MKGLRLAEGLTLPIDAIAARIEIPAMSGAGKTYAALKVVEHVFKSGCTDLCDRPDQLRRGVLRQRVASPAGARQLAGERNRYIRNLSSPCKGARLRGLLGWREQDCEHNL
jgi:hypothetical protein